MSTKAIREILERVKENPNGVGDADLGVYAAALEEVEAIERAAQVLTTEGIEDGVYKIRDRAAEDTSFMENTWKHPRVVAYSDAAQVIIDIAKEGK